MGAILSRPADSDQSMGQRRSLGNAAAPVFAHNRISLAGRPHRPRNGSRSARGNASRCSMFTKRLSRDHLAIPVFSGEKSESERFPGAVQTLSIEAMVQDRKSDPGRHVAFSRAKFCACERDSISKSRRQTGIWLDDELGNDDTADRHGDHDAWR